MIEGHGYDMTKSLKTDYAKAIIELFPALGDPASPRGGYVNNRKIPLNNKN